MERLGKEYAPIVEGIGCSNNSHRKQSLSPMAMTDTILATGNTGTVGTEEFCKTALRKRHQLPEIKSIFESRLNPRRDRGKQCNDSAQVCRGLCREGV